VKIKTILFLFAVVLGLALFAGAGYGEMSGQGKGKKPPLDPTLTAFKEQGVWYFLCEAPTYCQRIPPHYLIYGPPPPCGPTPPPQQCGPVKCK